MGDIEIQTVEIKTYDGTLESAKEVIKNLGLENNQYCFDPREKILYLNDRGLMLKKGDCYEVLLPAEKFEAIG